MIDSRIDDRTIDTVARRMTGAAASDEFAARVVASLPARQPAWTWHPWRLTFAGLGVVAAAVVVLAASATVSLPDPESRRFAPGPAIATAIPSSALVGQVIAPIPATPAASPPRRQADPSIYRLPALARPVALDVASIQPESLAIGLLELKPMATEPLAIPRVDPRGGSE